MFFVVLGKQTWRLYEAERALEIMDSTLGGSYSSEEGIRVIKIGLLCTQAASLLRPSMSQVLSMLTSEREDLPSPTKPPVVDLDGAGTPEASSTTPPDIHSAAVDSSGILEPR
jgi:hypothetical protein